MHLETIKLLRTILEEGAYPNSINEEALLKKGFTESTILNAKRDLLFWGTGHGFELNEKGFLILSSFELNQSIKNFDKASDKWSKRMNRYTLILIVLAYLTIVVTILGFEISIWNKLIVSVALGFILYIMLEKIPHREYLKERVGLP